MGLPVPQEEINFPVDGEPQPSLPGGACLKAAVSPSPRPGWNETAGEAAYKGIFFFFFSVKNEPGYNHLLLGASPGLRRLLPSLGTGGSGG